MAATAANNAAPPADAGASASGDSNRNPAAEKRKQEKDKEKVKLWISWDSLERRVNKKNWLVISGSADHTLKIWDLSAKSCRGTLEGPHEATVTAVVVDWTQRLALSAAMDGSVCKWNLERCELMESALSGKHGAVQCMEATLDAPYCAITGTRDGFLCVWDTARLRTTREIAAHEGARVVCCGADFTKKHAVTGATDGRLRQWDLNTGECLGTFESHERAITAAFIDCKRLRVLSGSEDGMLHLWHPDTRSPIAQLVGHEEKITCICVNLDVQKALTGSDDETVRFWDLTHGGRLLGTFTGHNLAVRDVQADFKRQVAVSTSDDSTLRVWDLETLNCNGVLESHLDRVLLVRFRAVPADEPLQVLSASSDYTMKVWELQYMSVDETFYGHAGAVQALTA